MIQDRCRLCLKDEYNVQNIFTLTTETISSFSKCISKFCNFEIKIDDGLPGGICESCISTVTYVHAIRKHFRSNQKKLIKEFQETFQHLNDVKPKDITTNTNIEINNLCSNAKILYNGSNQETIIRKKIKLPPKVKNKNLQPLVHLISIERAAKLFNYQKISDTAYRRKLPPKVKNKCLQAFARLISIEEATKLINYQKIPDTAHTRIKPNTKSCNSNCPDFNRYSCSNCSNKRTPKHPQCICDYDTIEGSPYKRTNNVNLLRSRSASCDTSDKLTFSRSRSMTRNSSRNRSVRSKCLYNRSNNKTTKEKSCRTLSISGNIRNENDSSIDVKNGNDKGRCCNTTSVNSKDVQIKSFMSDRVTKNDDKESLKFVRNKRSRSLSTEFIGNINTKHMCTKNYNNTNSVIQQTPKTVPLSKWEDFETVFHSSEEALFLPLLLENKTQM